VLPIMSVANRPQRGTLVWLLRIKKKPVILGMTQ
jgi:hypothetical protein